MVKDKIKEALDFQPLTADEKKDRHILGRLYGPCASIIDPTRNGRMYTEELWDGVFEKNEIINEWFENGGIPMELDHPEERTETKSGYTYLAFFFDTLPIIIASMKVATIIKNTIPIASVGPAVNGNT